MNKKTIIYYLQNPDLVEVLWNRADYLRKERLKYKNKQDEIMEEIAYGNQVSISYGNTSSKTNNVQDLSNTYKKTIDMIKKYDAELLTAYKDIIEKIGECNRVYLIFKILAPEDNKLLTELYIKHTGWKAVEIDFEINHKTLVKKVNNIFHNMCIMYESETLTDAKMARISYRQNNDKQNKMAKGKDIEGQTTLYDFYERSNDEKNE